MLLHLYSILLLNNFELSRDFGILTSEHNIFLLLFFYDSLDHFYGFSFIFDKLVLQNLFFVSFGLFGSSMNTYNQMLAHILYLSFSFFSRRKIKAFSERNVR